jgi:hypothetical protein
MSLVARCRNCGAENLVPAPLIARGLRRKYKQVIQRRLETDSLSAAHAIARTVNSEIAGWMVIGLAALGAAGWFLWGTLEIRREFLTDPVLRVAVPGFIGTVLGGFGLYGIASARLRRSRLRRAGPQRRRNPG